MGSIDDLRLADVAVMPKIMVSTDISSELLDFFFGKIWVTDKKKIQ